MCLHWGHFSYNKRELSNEGSPSYRKRIRNNKSKIILKRDNLLYAKWMPNVFWVWLKISRNSCPLSYIQKCGLLFFNQLFWQSSYLPLSLPLALSVQSICINVLKIRLSICYITKCLVFRWVQMQATVFEMTIFKRFSWVSFSAVLICVAACLRRCLSSFKTVDLYKRFFFSWFDYSRTSWLGQSETL